MKNLLLAGALLPFAVSSQVLITEVFYDTPGNDSVEEWIELTNVGCTEQSLAGWSIRDNSATYYLNGTLAPNQSYVIARSASGFESLYAAQPDASGLTLALGNSGDYVQLRDTNSTVDMVAWENKVSGWNIAAKYKTIYRNSPTDTDSVDDWAVHSGYGVPGDYDYPDTSCGGNGGGDGGGTNPGGEVGGPDGYYDDASGLTGQALKAKLGEIAARGHTQLTYSQVWDALSYSDEDPNNPNNVILFYTGRSQDKGYRSGVYNDGDAWNREHSWPKSLGFPSKSQWGYTDVHHLRPTDASMNSTRGNKDYDNGGSPVSESPDNKTDSNSFEPRDAVKGDAARMMFYMAVRYEGNDANMPDLYLVNDTSSNTGTPKLGVLCTLLAWNSQDPVDDWERRRHERNAEWQGNRNPFIDNAQWVDEIYGASCN
ncbi:endonuclease [Shewanella corallii]|uniref:Endonuclease n=1 Tax=Shewanella corallii TaxID=560080 RepID=A0ABT0N7L1_9GAMM|nr:endonuclease [Shewanella corallii]MCL2914080.1 endonuclease [Shewanella corallii]